jgi:hypothetical protein
MQMIMPGFAKDEVIIHDVVEALATTSRPASSSRLSVAA